MNLNDTHTSGGLTEADLDARIDAHFAAIPPRYKAAAGCDQQGRQETREWGRSGSGVLQSLGRPEVLELLKHPEADWLRASRAVGPVVTPCKPLPLLTRWAMRISAWFNRKV